MTNLICILLLIFTCCKFSLAADLPQAITLLESPGRELRPNSEGNPLVLINGRLLTPAGRYVRTQ
jgi:hypothetical protein